MSGDHNKYQKSINRRVGEETARTTISMMRSLAKNIPISPFHLAAADDMEALLNEVLKYRKENK
jgi:hypothetical protein